MSGAVKCMSSFPSNTDTADRPKMRPCLRCRTPFESGWPGERVCTACKGTRSWKSGEMARSVATRASHARSSGGSS